MFGMFAFVCRALFFRDFSKRYGNGGRFRLEGHFRIAVHGEAQLAAVGSRVKAGKIHSYGQALCEQSLYFTPGAGYIHAHRILLPFQAKAKSPLSFRVRRNPPLLSFRARPKAGSRNL